MRIFIFTGPTISEAECRTHLNATYLPPISQGDVASLLRFQPDVIGIIDGYFDQVPSVWHKEILLALSKGVQVVGAASMGALRAAELHPFGMQGVGKIFEWYRDGVIEADDEVALRHAPAELGYRPLSETLVNIRTTLEAAFKEGVINKPTHESLLEIGCKMPYWERSYPSLIDAGTQTGLETDMLKRLKDYCLAQRIDQKKEDAIALLRHIAGLKAEQPISVDFKLETTGYLNGLLDSDVRLGLPGNTSQPTLGELADFARLALPDFTVVMEHVGERRMRRMLANHLEIQVSESEIEQAGTAFRTRHQLESEEKLQDWLMRNATTQDELQEHLKQAALDAKLLNMFSVSSNRDMLWELREAGRFEALLASWQERNQAQYTSLAEKNVSQDELFALYRTLASYVQGENFTEASLRLGFWNRTNMLAELLKVYTHRSHQNADGNV